MNTAYNVILKNLRMLKYVMLKYTATSDIQTRIKVARVDKPADDGQHFFFLYSRSSTFATLRYFLQHIMYSTLMFLTVCRTCDI